MTYTKTGNCLMKKISIAISSLILLFVFGASANAALYSFSDKDFLSGASWGTMEVSVFDSDTLQISYEAASASVIPAGAQVTGFGFNFDVSAITVWNVWNPTDPKFTDDMNALNWVRMTGNVPSFAVANGDEFTPAVDKSDFTFWVTEGASNTFTPPGITPGNKDILFIGFSGVSFSGMGDAELFDFVNLTGIRLQSLPSSINGGSLFLAGNPVPLPGALILFGSGIIGLIGIRRRYNTQ